MKKETKTALTEYLAEAFSLPPDLFLGYPLISMSGNKALIIRNHKGIRQLGTKEILVATKSITIIVRGRGLSVRSFSKELIEINGYIEELRFCYDS